MSWDGKERRRKKRYGVKASIVRYRKGGLFAFLKPPSSSYLLLNFSELGGHFISREALPAGQALLLSIEAPSAPGTARARGTVVWSRKSEELNAHRVGVAFGALTARSRKLFKFMLDGAILDSVEISTKAYLKEIERL